MSEGSQSLFGGAIAIPRLLAAALLSLLCGCADDPPPVTDQPRDFANFKIDQVRPAGDGVDVEFWVVDLSPDAVGRALSPISADELTDAQGMLWRSNGLRIFKTAAAIADRIGKSLPLQGQARRDSLPLLPRWSSLASGRGWSSGVDVWLDQQDWSTEPGRAGPIVSTGYVQFGPGSLRLLARTWSIAAPADISQLTAGSTTLPAALTVQLMPQHIDSGPAHQDRLGSFAAPSLTNPKSEGQAFERLAIEITCSPGDAIIIVPAHPREQWVGMSASAPSEPGKPSDDVPVIEPSPPKRQPSADAEPAPDAPSTDTVPKRQPGKLIGPAVPELLTLGEAMLTDAIVGNTVGRRVMIVITPRVPAKFDPLPPVSSR